MVASSRTSSSGLAFAALVLAFACQLSYVSAAVFTCTGWVRVRLACVALRWRGSWIRKSASSAFGAYVRYIELTTSFPIIQWNGLRRRPCRELITLHFELESRARTRRTPPPADFAEIPLDERRSPPSSH